MRRLPRRCTEGTENVVYVDRNTVLYLVERIQDLPRVSAFVSTTTGIWHVTITYVQRLTVQKTKNQKPSAQIRCVVESVKGPKTRGWTKGQRDKWISPLA